MPNITTVNLRLLFSQNPPENIFVNNFKVLLFTFFIAVSCFGQSPTDALMMPSKNICILVSYESESFNKYWEGSYLRKNESIGTLSRKSFAPMAAIGLYDNLNVYLSLPYIKTASSEPNGGYFAGAQGWQDIGIAIKYKILQKPMPSGDLNMFSTVSYSTPSTKYLSDYMPYSLGLGTSEFGIRGIAQFQIKDGFYIRTMFGHLWRGYTKSERDYYYNNGSYYSNKMDVPNAWNFEAVLGVWLIDNSMQLELNYNGLKSTSGDDIRAYNAPQPTNKVKVDQIGISAHYYFKAIKGLGVLAYRNSVVNGLNTAKISNSGLGLTFQFNYAENKNEEQNEE